MEDRSHERDDKGKKPSSGRSIPRGTDEHASDEHASPESGDEEREGDRRETREDERANGPQGDRRG